MIKKILISLTVVLLTFSPLLPIVSNAVSPKLVYKTGDAFLDATTKAIQARKGVTIEGIEWVGDAPPPKKVFTKSVQKELQDVAMDAYNTIDGSRLNATPLRNNPQWLKVFIGTTAFLSGADIVLDVYDLFNTGSEVGSLEDSLRVGQTYSSLGNGAEMRFQKTWENAYGKWNDYALWTKPEFQMRFYPNGSFTPNNSADWVMYGAGGISTEFPKTISIKLDQVTTTSMIFSLSHNGEKYEVKRVDNLPVDSWEDVGAYPTVVPTAPLKPALNPINGTVAPIDTGKETQVLLIPNPEVVPVEDMDQLIKDNPDMVSDPDTWLQNNPDADPDVNPDPDPDPDPTPTGDSNGYKNTDGTWETATDEMPSNPWKNLVPTVWLLDLLDFLRAVLEYIGRLFKFMITIPFVDSIPIENEAFVWFRNVEILGIKIFDVMTSFATIGLSFSIFKVVRRVLP